MSFTRGLLSRFSTDPDYYHLLRCIKAIPQLPISQRKLILSICQTGELDDTDLRSVFVGHVHDVHNKSDLKHSDFTDSLRIAISCIIQRSFLWMLTRTCPEPPFNDESDDVRSSGFSAEIGATQTIFAESQTISYSSFFRWTRGINDPGQWWVDQSHAIRRNLHASLNGKILYPAVNRNKNVSQQTMAAINANSDAFDYVRTVDLEVLYAKTSIAHGGDPEVRTAWKFNGLKPRIYYCTGGLQYWASRYMKVIAVKLMEAIPSTHVKLRTSPTDFLSSDFQTDYVTAWDYTAFTSNLSELKHFVWYVARMMEEDQTTVTLFDYRDGYIYDVPLYKLLDEYNEVANMHARFSVHRMVGKFLDDNPDLYASLNSGMLGVHGNIGFSTALHGLVICKECGRNRCVCVGDDGLGVTSEDPAISLIPAISKLGILHPEKFGLLGPGDDVRHIKFLKRRLARVGDTFVLSTLLNFPITAYIDGDIGSRDKPIKFSMQDRIYKFSTHVAELLWDMERFLPQLTETGITIALNILRKAYRYLRLPYSGLFPGQTFRISVNETFELNFTLPRIEGYHPNRGDWIEFMIGHSPTMFFKAPVYTSAVEMDHIPTGYHMLPESAYLSALEDLGLLETEKIFEWIYVAHVGSSRALARMIRRVDDGQVKALAVRVFKDIPDRFLLRSVRKVGQSYDIDGMEDI